MSTCVACDLVDAQVSFLTAVSCEHTFYKPESNSSVTWVTESLDSRCFSILALLIPEQPISVALDCDCQLFNLFLFLVIQLLFVFRWSPSRHVMKVALCNDTIRLMTNIKEAYDRYQLNIDLIHGA